jgi:catechol 2,3-dioxygenase-like lactoylglutathione lyase family enzyme
MSTTSIRVDQIGTVFVPVTEQDRALKFYVEQLGFEKRMDFAYGGGRWVEVAPPGSIHRLALVAVNEGESSDGRQTYCAFETRNVEAMHLALRERGMHVSEIARVGSTRSGLFSDAVNIPDPVPSQFFIRDLDGNQFLIVQAG